MSRVVTHVEFAHFFFFQAEDGIRDVAVTGVQTCALPISVLTPLAFDPGRPFPHISSGSLNLAVVVGDNQGTEIFARVKVPDSLPRLVLVETDHQHKKVSTSLKSEMKFVWLEQLIIANLHLLFPGMEIVEAHAFRVTRDAEVAIQELESDDLLERDRKSTRLNSSHGYISYAVFCLKKKKPDHKCLYPL